MKPVVAIVGRPNVGKSSLFNRLTGSHKAIIDDQPGVTRDRIYGDVKSDNNAFILVDTGGVEFSDDDVLQKLINQQVEQVVEEADIILFMVDGQVGRTNADDELAANLRKSGAKTVLIVNKSEGLGQGAASSDFTSYGFNKIIPISAKRGDGLKNLTDHIIHQVPYAIEEPDGSGPIRIAFIGRPNVGKSTLTNAIAGEERVVVMDMPGTTRDSIEVDVIREDGREYTLIDTAGVRRKGKIGEELERLSVVRSLQAIDSAHVCILIFDAREGVVDQDSALAGLVAKSGKSFVVAFNKWDGLTEDQRYKINYDVDINLSFLVEHERVRLAAKYGTGVGEILQAADRAHASAFAEVGTGEVNRIVQQAITQMSPPRVGRRPIRIKYAHQGGVNPPNFVIHGNRVTDLPQTYQRYIAHTLQKKLALVGTPVRLTLRDAENPYFDKSAPKKRAALNKNSPKRRKMIREDRRKRAAKKNQQSVGNVKHKPKRS